jgi:hypothetical protein
MAELSHVKLNYVTTNIINLRGQIIGSKYGLCFIYIKYAEYHDILSQDFNNNIPKI